MTDRSFVEAHLDLRIDRSLCRHLLQTPLGRALKGIITLCQLMISPDDFNDNDYGRIVFDEFKDHQPICYSLMAIKRLKQKG